MVKHYKSPLLSVISTYSNNYQYTIIPAETMITSCYGSIDRSKYNYYPSFQCAYTQNGDGTPIFSCTNTYVNGIWIESYVHSAENLNTSIYAERLVKRAPK